METLKLVGKDINNFVMQETNCIKPALCVFITEHKKPMSLMKILIYEYYN